MIWTFDDGSTSKTFGSGINQFVMTINADSTPGKLSINPGGSPNSLETVTIKLTDGGGAFTTQSLSLDFRKGEFDPLSFNRSQFNI